MSALNSLSYFILNGYNEENEIPNRWSKDNIKYIMNLMLNEKDNV